MMCQICLITQSISNTFIRTGSILWMICSNLIAESGHFWLSPAFLLITQSEVNDQFNVWILAMQQKHPTLVIQLESGHLGGWEQREWWGRAEGQKFSGEGDKGSDGGRGSCLIHIYPAVVHLELLPQLVPLMEWYDSLSNKYTTLPGLRKGEVMGYNDIAQSSTLLT